MKKIALAIENFSRQAGGAESYGVSLACMLQDSGWEVHLFGQRWDGEPRSAVFHPINIPKTMPAWAKMIWFALRHKQLVATCDFDVVLGFGNTIQMNVYQSHGGVHRFSANRKVYAERNAVFRTVKRLLITLSPKHRARHWIESAPFRLNQRPRMVAISQMIKDDMENFFSTAKDEIEVVYNGVDTNKYNSALRQHGRGSLRKKWGISDNDVIFLFVSYELKKKGIEPLVAASAYLKKDKINNFRVIVVGGTPYPSLRRRIQKRDLNEKIIFIGRSTHIEEYYANSDVLVLPTYYDACSLVVFEAMACGLPVITTVYNGAAGMMSDGKHGYIISHPPDPTELAEKMKHLMARDIRGKMSLEAAVSGSKFSIEKNHRKMLKIFQEVAD